MTVRIVTWNVNGIRNPFKYSPWNKDRTLRSMFDILEADIVCFQEVKTPKASLTDDLVFVEGWDSFYSFPHSLTGYSGVAVYTRDSKCVPLRVEEGVTGILKIPSTQTRYIDAPAANQIGGYPTDRQLRRAAVGRDVIDSEGRCLIVEFPLFVLINVYCPARRNHERTGFRNTFLLVLDARVRNLAAAGKNVVLCGDLNIMRDQLDTPGIWGHQGQKVVSEALEFDETYMTMRATKILNQLLFNSRTIADTGVPFVDEATEVRRPPVLYDTGRELHPTRAGMFTCWDTRKNHRPANFGSRIDYIMCSPKIMQLVTEAEIQPHLHGSDHCPVFIVLRAAIDGDESANVADDKTTKSLLHVLDYLNPPGRFTNGQQILSSEEDNILLKKRFPQSGRRMAQFANRRHIASMFQKAQRASEPPKSTETSDRWSVKGGADTAPELPALFKADVVELVESDDEDVVVGTIEDEDASDTEEDSRLASENELAKKTPQLSQEPNLAGQNSQKTQPQPSISANYAGISSSTPLASPKKPASIAGATFIPLIRDPVTANETNDTGGKPQESGAESSTLAGMLATAIPASQSFKRESLPTLSTKRSLVRSHSGIGSQPAPQVKAATRTAGQSSARSTKRAKTAASSSVASPSSSSGTQMSINMFLAARPPAKDKDAQSAPPPPPSREAVPLQEDVSDAEVLTSPTKASKNDNDDGSWMTADEVDAAFRNLDAAKASWSLVGLGQRQAPLCEHGELCKTFVTKKAGLNSGRSFFMCARPPGPLGKREKGTAWQCTTFVWCRDWRPGRSD
ncbi:Class II abasic (AP) endonuclease [Sporothrix epigloea]|uniref:DNA-(apurinic or apyrimidinic site) endonuclease 2 n=1 Tax=Sporothrix epigloea TaxID=1892477 RepID=A0ABP0DKP3_9PEZI